MLSGVGEATWRNIERGGELRGGTIRPSTKPPQRLTVRRIAKLLEWPVTDAMRWAGYDDADVEDEPDDDTDEGSYERLREELDQLLQQLTDQQIRSLIAMIEAFTEPHGPSRFDDDPQHPVRVHTIERGIGEADMLGNRMRREREQDKRPEGTDV